MHSLVPLLVMVLALLASVASSRAAGQIVVWGDTQPIAVPKDAVNIRAIAAGSLFSVALQWDGTVLSWGWEQYPHVPPGLSNVAAIAAGRSHDLALKNDGTVIAWGNNFYGQTNVPPGLTNAAAVAAGGDHSLALRRNGTMIAWGSNSNGQTNVPPGLTNVAAIAAGGYHSLALRTNGTVIAWGSSSHGQTYVPFWVTNVATIAAGGDYNLALRSNGTVVAWGSNSYGQTNVPPGLTNVAAIAAGGIHCLALRSNGTVIAWGYNAWGQTHVPPGLTNVTAIAAGGGHSLALLKDWPPTILVQPISQSVIVGHACIMSILASSSEPFGYQWRFQGNDIPGATNSELTLSAMQFVDAGDYTVVVNNALGSETSQPATVTVINPWPNIRTQPVSQPFHEGDTVILRVLGDGPGPLNYQWLHDGIAIPGATDTTLVVSNATYASRGIYTVIVRNPYGSATSNPALLFLLFGYEFSAPEGPLIWDFSGTYPSPLLTLQQSQDGFLFNNDGAHGRVSGSGSSVEISLTRSKTNGYWVYHGSTHKEQILKDTCTTSLTLDSSRGLLVGTDSCLKISQEYEWFLFTWAAYRNLTTISYSATLAQPLPDGVNGHWRLAMGVVTNGNQLAGRAFITLSRSNVISFDVTGTNSTVNKSVMQLQGSLNQLNVVTTGPEMALQSIHGNVAGQSVDYDAPVGAVPLTLNMNGGGSFTPLKNGQALVVGKDYTLRAVPRPGNLFSNWIVGGVVDNNPRLRFTMTSNLVIVASFVPNPFLGLKGSYTGLFYDTSSLSHFSAGFVTLTVADKGAFSGRLQQGSAKYPFNGQFGLALSAQTTSPRKGTNEVVVRLQLAAGSDQVLGTVSHAAWTSELFGYRTVFNSRSNPATNFAGSYTLLLPGTGAADSAEGPMGHGFAQLSVNRGGDVSFKGTLGDGSAAVQKVSLAANGQWPFYASLYSGKGSALGWLTLLNTPTNDVIGPVLWTKPGGVKGALHPAGFTNELESLGSRYVAPASGTRVLDFTNGVVVLDGGNLSAALTNAVLLSERNQVTVDAPNTQKLSLTLTVPSGAFSGSFAHPQTGRMTPLKGVLLQKQNVGAGFFSGTDQSGRVFFGERESKNQNRTGSGN